MHAELQGALKAVMSRLPRRTREIVTLYHWRGLTMREIGVRYGINESRVSQIHKRALGLMAGRAPGAGDHRPRVGSAGVSERSGPMRDRSVRSAGIATECFHGGTRCLEVIQRLDLD